MSFHEDSAYFVMRERREREAAKSAAAPGARRAHQELAQAYATMARDMAAAPAASLEPTHSG